MSKSNLRHLFLLGEKQIGKTTVLQRLLRGHTLRLGGFLTRKVRTPTGANIHMLPAWKEAACTPENLLFSRSNGILHLEPGRFDRLGCSLLAAREDCRLLIMDELGPSEATALGFQKAVLECLAGETPVYGVLQRGDTPFQQAIRRHPEVCLVTVTAENRDVLPAWLREQGW